MLVYPTGIPTGSSGYTITNALMLDGSADYLSKTFSGAGNNKIGTLSFWVKRNKIGENHQLFHSRSGSGYSQLVLDSNDKIYWRLEDTGGNQVGQKTTKAVFRDPTAWTHIVVNFSCAAAQQKIYVNGSEVAVADLATSVNPSDTDTTISDAATHYIGALTLPVITQMCT